MEAEAKKSPYRHRTITQLTKEMPNFTEWLIKHDKMLDLYPDFFLVLRNFNLKDSTLTFRSYFTKDNYIEGKEKAYLELDDIFKK